jgi:hypothetical protein
MDAPEGDLCARTFEPYPDLITGRARTPLNAAYLDAMALYAQGDYAGARDGLKPFLKVQRADLSPYIYLACCHLALGEPYEAELQLDHLERSSLLQFDDQVQWYTVVCWVCSGQLDRARTGAQRIVAARAHTYRKEAMALLEELGSATGQ